MVLRTGWGAFAQRQPAWAGDSKNTNQGNLRGDCSSQPVRLIARAALGDSSESAAIKFCEETGRKRSSWEADHGAAVDRAFFCAFRSVSQLRQPERLLLAVSQAGSQSPCAMIGRVPITPCQ